ncbi:hypothetical protein BDY21DRAFT_387001 [Lineolata rhizophorae]|uniref:ATP-dependent DNA ligase family profile domain-containing protein n=1 Tax=Lineolata rhizophorae TaxID=578093 RepID=A0A6A6NW13_9PEZI|nr:hypothetical protein BDY21DRAFT_387001 [Lineolata rhizophorae]
MPLHFGSFCDLLKDLEAHGKCGTPFLRKNRQDGERRIIRQWFRGHRAAIDKPDTNRAALLSSLFPERRKDRVYHMQVKRLSFVIARCLNLTTSKLETLNGWKAHGKGDLGDCIERVLRVHDKEPLLHPVTVEEVDEALDQLASRIKASSPAMRAHPCTKSAEEILKVILLRMRSVEAKWFVRIVLQNLAPIHFLLPSLLRFQDSFSAASQLLDGPLKKYPANPDPEPQKLFEIEAATLIRPQIGVQVGRPTFHKARSMGHCMRLVGDQVWSVEEKFDGEYCEVHIDLEKGRNCIQIFSKSGKDSTDDCKGLHSVIRDSLQIGAPQCTFKKRCIVVGEMVVFSEKEDSIVGFHKIRKHVTRAGRFININNDSPPDKSEHLMMIYYDVLMIDDESVMTQPYARRRDRLRQLVKKLHGRSMTSMRAVIDFSEENAQSRLTVQFSRALACRYEGLVLKPLNAPYFSLISDPDNWRWDFIKLKKDYMTDMGSSRDVVDLAIIGASYKAAEAHKTDMRFLKWTTFYAACLTNKDDMRFDSRPRFRITHEISLDDCIKPTDLKTLNEHGQFREEPLDEDGYQESFEIELDQTLAKNMTTAFKEPSVAEVLGSGFEKAPNQSFFHLRHPRILKLHWDHLADKARNAPPDEDLSQQTKEIVDRLVRQIRKESRRTGCSPSQLKRVPSPSAKRKSAETPTKISENTSVTITPSRASHTRDKQNSTASHKPRTRRTTIIRKDTCEKTPDQADGNPPDPSAATTLMQTSALRLLTDRPSRHSTNTTK